MEVGQEYFITHHAERKLNESLKNDSLLGKSGVGLRRGLRDGTDIQILSKIEWEELKQKSNDLHPEIIRRVISRGLGYRMEKVVELYPLLTKVESWATSCFIQCI
jgi:hypothetical protein